MWGGVSLFATGALTLAILFLSIWYHLPSRKQYIELAFERRYAPVLQDRHHKRLAVAHEKNDPAGAYVSIEDIPAWFLEDLKLLEGYSFYGPKIGSLGRAWWTGIGGGSTITMQTARLLSGFDDENYWRKLIEVVASVKLALTFSEAELFEIYLNNASFVGINRDGHQRGLADATHKLFSKAPAKLTRAEALILYTCLPRPKRCAESGEEKEGLTRVYRKKRNELVEAGRIPDDTTVVSRTPPPFTWSFFTKSSHALGQRQALEEAAAILAASGSGITLEDGVIIETTIDQAISDTLADVLVDYVDGKRWNLKGISVLLLNPMGEVLAYVVNGYAARSDNDLLAAEATMPASRFKVVVYVLLIAHLLEEGLTPEQIRDYKLPTVYVLPDGRVVDDPEAPHPITLREAIIRSRNAPAYFAANEILSPDLIVRFARHFGLDLDSVPSIAHGSQSVSELTLSSIFATLLVRDGYLVEPSFVRRILWRDGHTVLYDRTASSPPAGTQVVASKAIWMLKQMLREAVYEDDGTSRRLLQVAPSLRNYDLAAKTGTSPSDSRYKYRGVTGSIGSYTFSVLLQGYRLPDASRTAVPAAGEALDALVRHEMLK